MHVKDLLGDDRARVIARLPRLKRESVGEAAFLADLVTLRLLRLSDATMHQRRHVRCALVVDLGSRRRVICDAVAGLEVRSWVGRGVGWDLGRECI